MTGTYPQVQPPRKPQQGSGAGCWLIAFISLFIAMVLVILGMFLPPFNLYDRLFGEQYNMLSVDSPSVAYGTDFAVNVSADDTGEAFGVQIDRVGLSDFETINANAGEWIPAAKNSLPFYLALQSPVYTLESTGTAPDEVTFSISLPLNAASPELLDVYGWDGDEWHFIPSSKVNGKANASADFMPQEIAIFQTAPLAPTVAVFYDVTDKLNTDVSQLATIVSPAGLQPTQQGTLIGSLAPGIDLNAGYRVLPVIRNFDDPRATDPDTIVNILSNSKVRKDHVKQITNVASQNGYDGIFIDYRALPDSARENFSTFISELSDGLSNTGLMLGVVVPGAQNEQGDWITGAYDWQSIGLDADFVVIQMGIDPQIYGPEATQRVNAMLRWAVDKLDRYKILMGLSAQSVRDVNGQLTRIGYNEAIAGMGNVVVEAQNVSETGSIEPGSEVHASLDGLEAIAGVDTVINTPFLDYLSEPGDPIARMWLTTASALHYRMERTIPVAIAGVAFDDLLDDDLVEDVNQAILSYKAQVPAAPSPTDLALRWTVEGSNGVIDELVTGLNEDLVLTLAAPDGNYAINIAVVGIGAEAESQRTGAAVALFSPTSTPTPLPTATPTQIPTATPTPVPIVPTAAPANTGGTSPGGGGFSAVAPPAGSISIEIGGHVTDASSSRAIGAMHSAGMTWMKVQARYSPSGSSNVAGQIQAAHSNGFKILVGTVGNPAELGQGGQGYINGYASWLSQIAAAGADAIEVWNEPNLDREWPAGQISGVAYAGMLQVAYGAIKSANGNTMVISAAPAPTGAEAAYPGQVMNDDRWLQEMVAGGGLNALDCVGAHYNEGIVSPSQSSGDPRDGYYTRYFSGMLNTYYSITGRPICFTELGYLTSEGFPALPGFFSWAQNVTLGQQAAWLAEAAALASRSGQVRLMIVWNIDFTHYGADPQAGYAIVRPDGSCPACVALASAR